MLVAVDDTYQSLVPLQSFLPSAKNTHQRIVESSHTLHELLSDHHLKRELGKLDLKELFQGKRGRSGSQAGRVDSGGK